MITTKVSGGLGNQMFQYAMGRAIAARLGTELQMDLFFYRHGQPPEGVQRIYALDVFRVKERFVPDVQSRHATAIRTFLRRVYRKLRRMLGYPVQQSQTQVFTEKSFPFDATVFEVGDNTCFEGYWQSEKYFMSIDDEIRRAFTLKDGLSGHGQQLTVAMRAGESVSLHVRRGDYVQSATTNAVHGTCTPEYYAKAIAYVAAHVTAPHFYVFSDDIEWVKANLPIDHPVTWLSDGVLKDYEELALMASCRHNIIANSSFSWWGAWLNDNPSKVVIAPARWFAKGDLDTRDLIPETWVKI